MCLASSFDSVLVCKLKDHYVKGLLTFEVCGGRGCWEEYVAGGHSRYSSPANRVEGLSFVNMELQSRGGSHHTLWKGN